MGFPFKDFLYDLCGGPLPGRKFKAIIPGGISVPIQTLEEAEATLMDYEGFVAQGHDARLRRRDRLRRRAEPGEADRARRALLRPRELRAVHAVPRRHGVDDEDPRAHRRDGEGTHEDLDTLLEIADNMTGKTICVLSDSCATPVVSGIKKFRAEFEALDQEEEVPPRYSGGGIDGDYCEPTTASPARMVNLTIEGRPVSGP